jgi:hypothetical protein
MVGQGLLLTTSASSSPGSAELILAAIFTVGWIAFAFRIKTYWRLDPSTYGADMIRRTRRQRHGEGYVRSAPSMVFSAGLFTASVWAAVGVQNSQSLWKLIPFVILLLCVLVSLSVSASIWFFNRPRIFVPPKLRDGPNYFSKDKLR